MSFAIFALFLDEVGAAEASFQEKRHNHSAKNIRKGKWC